jgi:hypothetical protein
MNKPKLTRAEKIQLSISSILRVIILATIISAGIKKNWLTLAVATFALVLTFLPSLIQRNYKFYLPTEFELLMTILVVGSLFLGEIYQYYVKFWWWDLFLHTYSGIIFGFLGFFMLYVLYREKKIKTSYALLAVFSFCFAVAIGSIWEILEFTLDRILNLDLQRTGSGVVDTMWDLIVNAAGSLLTATAGYFYVKGGDSLIVNKIVHRYIKKNPDLFKKHHRKL